MSRIPLLPLWVLPSVTSVYDLESSTVSEMVPKVYGAMRNLIEDYNKFAEEINQTILTFTGSSNEEIANFKQTIEQRLICKFNDMDARYNEIKVELMRYSDAKISEIYDHYLNGYANQLINEKIASGDIEITLVYDPETESLNMTTGGV